MARLSDADVVRLRERYSAGARQVELAEEFGVAQTSVSAIVAGKTRADAGGPIAVPSPRARVGAGGAPAQPRARLTDAVVAEVRERVAAGEARAEAAAALGISKASVDSIMSGRRGGATAQRVGSLDDAARARIRAAHAAGQSQSAIARAEGTSQQMVSKVLRSGI
ncbi:hypothetical protein [Demequina sp. NBRC 110055]|uniref:hypothetical protein n=1 Tax=Demequina sp. NBRC 110055 TaxID=1570344 RepID=UPI000A0623EF|nr:hypothetical protein [Demequina sp. NBRC 110055]